MNFPKIETASTETVVEYRCEGGNYVLDYHLTGGFKRGEVATLMTTGTITLHEDLKVLKSEDYIQTAFIDFARLIVEPLLPEAKWIHHVPNGGKRTAREGAKMKRLGVKRGVPDICFPYVSPNGEPGLYIEFKEIGGVQTPEQREFEAYVKEQGYVYAVALTPLQAVYILQDYTQINFTEHLTTKAP